MNGVLRAGVLIENGFIIIIQYLPGNKLFAGWV